MRTIASVCFVLLAASAAANPTALDDVTHLSRSSIVAKIGVKEATVSAVYQIDFGAEAEGSREVFFALPIPEGGARAASFDKANVFASLADGTTPQVRLRPAPEKYDALPRPKGVDLIWATFEVDLRGNPQQRVSLTYVSPLVDETLYYLPLLTNQEAEVADGRHQLFAYSARRPLRPVGEFAYESFGAEAVAILHDKQWVGFR